MGVREMKRKAIELVGIIAAMNTMEELGEAGDLEDAAATLDELISSARQIIQFAAIAKRVDTTAL